MTEAVWRRPYSMGLHDEVERERSDVFFQAEDGIRDLTVTGVQTCALPIFVLQAGECAESFDNLSADSIRDQLKIILQMAVVLTYAAGLPVVKVGRIAGQFAKRSEERRVGEECRSRWSPDHLKKKKNCGEKM